MEGIMDVGTEGGFADSLAAKEVVTVGVEGGVAAR
jgi:hypothetical protein